MLGEHYLPCLSYESSPYAAVNPFEAEPVKKALAAVGNLHARIVDLADRSGNEEVRIFLQRAAGNDSAMLASRAAASCHHRQPHPCVSIHYAAAVMPAGILGGETGMFHTEEKGGIFT